MFGKFDLASCAQNCDAKWLIYKLLLAPERCSVDDDVCGVILIDALNPENTLLPSSPFRRPQFIMTRNRCPPPRVTSGNFRAVSDMQWAICSFHETREVADVRIPFNCMMALGFSLKFFVDVFRSRRRVELERVVQTATRTRLLFGEETRTEIRSATPVVSTLNSTM